MAAKLINSSDESSMGSAVYFSRRVFTENLKQKHTENRVLEKHRTKKSTSVPRIREGFDFSLGCVLLKAMQSSHVLYTGRQTYYCI